MRTVIRSKCAFCCDTRRELCEWPHDGQMGSPTCTADMRLSPHPGVGHDRGRPEPRRHPSRQDHGWTGRGTLSGAGTGT